VTALDAKDPGLIPARDPSVLTIRDILAAMRSYGDPFILPDGPASLPIYRLVNEAEATATEPLSKVTLKELVAKVGSPPPAEPQPPAPAA
jgi:DNA-binding IscR family transcriptional regulator